MTLRIEVLMPDGRRVPMPARERAHYSRGRGEITRTIVLEPSDHPDYRFHATAHGDYVATPRRARP